MPQPPYSVPHYIRLYKSRIDSIAGIGCKTDLAFNLCADVTRECRLQVVSRVSREHHDILFMSSYDAQVIWTRKRGHLGSILAANIDFSGNDTNNPWEILQLKVKARLSKGVVAEDKICRLLNVLYPMSRRWALPNKADELGRRIWKWTARPSTLLASTTVYRGKQYTE